MFEIELLIRRLEDAMSITSAERIVNLASFFAGYIGAFLLGSLCTMLLMVLLLGLIYYLLPTYRSQSRAPEANAESPLRKRSSDDPQLSKSGWLCISHDVLPEPLLYDHIFESMQTSQVRNRENLAGKIINESRGRIVALSGTLSAAYNKTYNVGSFLLARFLGDQELPIPAQDAYESPSLLYPDGVQAVLPKKTSWKNYYAVLRQKTLYLYSDSDQAHCLQVILVSNFKVRIHPRALSDVEMYQRTKSIQLTARKEFETLFFKGSPKIYHFYAPTKSDKEDWFFLLRRASRLPEFADSGALSVFYQELDPMKAYVQAMKALMTNTTSQSNSDLSPDSVAWLNALVGRAFVAIHSNHYVKEWLMHRLSTAYSFATKSDNASFLGDIVIQDISVGNSLPVLSNPRLLSLSVDEDMKIEFDIDYTGGIRIEAGTVATLSVEAWNRYVKPITVPLVVALKVKRFSARVLLKIKPFWESNRIWFGFYRQPELKLEIEVEPVISNKLIKFSLVNQVIEHRIKQALDEFVMLPNMDDLAFWPWEDIVGSSRYADSDSESDVSEYSEAAEYDSDFASDSEEGTTEIVNALLEGKDMSTMPRPRKAGIENSTDSEESDDDEQIPFQRPIHKEASAALAGEVVESTLRRRSNSVTDLKPRPRQLGLLTDARERPLSLYAPDFQFREQLAKTAIENLPDPRLPSMPPLNSPPPAHLDDANAVIDSADSVANFSSTESATVETKSTSDNTSSTPVREASNGVIPQQNAASPSSPSYMEYLGNAASGLGKIVRRYGLDERAKTVAKKVASISKPAIDYASNTTTAYTDYVQATAVAVGMSAIDKLGLRPEDSQSSLGSAESDTNLPLVSNAETADSQEKKINDDNVTPTSSPKKSDAVRSAESTHTLRGKRSTVFNVFGVSVMTSPPPAPMSPARSNSLSRDKSQSASDPRLLRRPKRSQSARISARQLFHGSTESLVTDSSEESSRSSVRTTSIRHSLDLSSRPPILDKHAFSEPALDSE